MEVWIDKQGGRHYHKADCPMVKDPMFNYEPIQKVIRKYKYVGYAGIRYGGKIYAPCPGCFGK